MRVIKTTTLKDFAKKHSTAASAVNFMIPLLENATWKSLVETRKYFPHADEVIVKSGSTVTVLNLGGNNWRVLTAIHYNRQTIYILEILTHAEYSREKWKDRL